jgi:hypothetical protein
MGTHPLEQPLHRHRRLQQRSCDSPLKGEKSGLCRFSLAADGSTVFIGQVPHVGWIFVAETKGAFDTLEVENTTC